MVTGESPPAELNTGQNTENKRGGGDASSVSGLLGVAVVPEERISISDTVHELPDIVAGGILIKQCVFNPQFKPGLAPHLLDQFICNTPLSHLRLGFHLSSPRLIFFCYPLPLISYLLAAHCSYPLYTVFTSYSLRLYFSL